MSNDLMMRIKDQALIVLADYATCKLDFDWEWERKSVAIAQEIAERMINNYMALTGRKKVLPYITLAKARIEVMILEAARAKHDPWATCRDEGLRIRTAYDIARAIDSKAGEAHKFSVWSAHLYGVKGFGRNGASVLIAAPSMKKAVDMANAHFGLHENLSWASEHWSGGGTVGKRVATKIGIWVAADKFKTEDGYKLVWEPK